MLKRLFSFLKQPATIKVVSLLLIIGLFFVVPVFADTKNEKALTDISEFLQNFIAFCSRGWVILAIIAGKLMTNDFVYGAFIHMDSYLWKIWNIMKNFANFALIALVIGTIIKGLVGKEALDVKKTITNTLIAGVLIQASRFMMGALIDLSTIASVAVSGFPSSFIQSNTIIKNTMNQKSQAFGSKRLVIDMDTSPKDGITTIPDTVEQSPEELRQTFLPTSKSISGPFIYLGMGIFQFQDVMSIAADNTAVTMTLSFALRFVLIFFFTIALLLLVIANIMRIGFLRIFIIGAPFLILVLLFKPKTGDNGLGKLFSLSNLMTIVFKPVIFIAAMSLMLIVVLSMHSVMIESGANLKNIGGVEFDVQTGSSTMVLEGISTVELKQSDIFGEGVIEKGQNTFAMLIVMLLTMFLMRWIVKLALTMGSDPISKTMEKMTGRAEDMAKSLPVLPLRGGASFNAIKGFGRAQTEKIARDGFEMNTEGKFDVAEAAFQNKVNKWMGLKDAWTSKDYTELRNIIRTNPNEFINTSINMAKDREGGLNLGDSQWIALFETWAKTSNNLAIAEFSTIHKPFETFEKFFDGDDLQDKANRAKLHELLGGNDAIYGSSKGDANGNIPYSVLSTAVYHKGDTP